jgi:hypothetical protein
VRTNPIYVLRVGDVLSVFSTDEQTRISFTEAPRRPIYGSEESFANLADPAAAM